MVYFVVWQEDSETAVTSSSFGWISRGLRGGTGTPQSIKRQKASARHNFFAFSICAVHFLNVQYVQSMQ